GGEGDQEGEYGIERDGGGAGPEPLRDEVRTGGGREDGVDRGLSGRVARAVQPGDLRRLPRGPVHAAEGQVEAEAEVALGAAVDGESFPLEPYGQVRGLLQVGDEHAP